MNKFSLVIGITVSFALYGSFAQAAAIDLSVVFDGFLKEHSRAMAQRGDGVPSFDPSIALPDDQLLFELKANTLGKRNDFRDNTWRSYQIDGAILSTNNGFELIDNSAYVNIGVSRGSDFHYGGPGSELLYNVIGFDVGEGHNYINVPNTDISISAANMYFWKLDEDQRITESDKDLSNLRFFEDYSGLGEYQGGYIGLWAEIDGIRESLQIPVGDALNKSLLNFDRSAFSPHVSLVPLPTALPLLATGVAALGLMGWRKRNAV